MQQRCRKIDDDVARIRQYFLDAERERTETAADLENRRERLCLQRFQKPRTVEDLHALLIGGGFLVDEIASELKAAAVERHFAEIFERQASCGARESEQR